MLSNQKQRVGGAHDADDSLLCALYFVACQENHHKQSDFVNDMLGFD